LVLDPSRRSFVSRRRDDDLVVEGSEPLFQLGWGGTRNHALEFVGGSWWCFTCSTPVTSW
jgi:hypothetical protein